MADSSEKTEDPTGKRLEEARNKGQIARSRELSTTLVLVASSLMFLLFGSFIAEALFAISGRMFTLSRDETYDPTHMFSAWGVAISEVSVPVISFMLVSMIAGIYGSIALGGYNFTWYSAAPRFSKLNPLSGFKRMFGVNGLVELLKAFAKFFVIGAMALISLSLFQDEALHLDQEIYPLNIFHALDMIEWAFFLLTLGMVPIALFDVPYQSYKHNEQMKMTKQQVKDERKNSEGDPQVKGRIRKLQYQAATRRMMQEVPKADVVVTNPTHYSVALKYDEHGVRAPVVIAKGSDELAMHIRKIATAHDVPLIPSPMLTRAIYYTTEVDEEIPHKLFMAVAQVLAYVFQLKKYKAGKAKRPKPLARDLPIPPDMRY
ncbi:MAG TPA: flagellar biosynthesis protein FlhB [Alteromonas sp.]|jgi:flagellar biosynthetic protein FlhB|nr:flagellar biosynthesis protein FlhB [Alteromonas sp.]HCA75665.1 flagellar biosynthesis protein FlhB [Alteromonas sp.]HCB16422.1 flagellar biosynthesis protein FlhB [Alteromonas sp.]HCV19350.1 flagellar biosynthesis protein FlhB [Alteromonas sp.]|tara:strand:- start:8276 stop:9400 length:1125 start_codon:yes stop_codon:yes gene_type:complete